jgi:tetratricopeptide (TPR) repeat protein
MTRHTLTFAMLLASSAALTGAPLEAAAAATDTAVGATAPAQPVHTGAAVDPDRADQLLARAESLFSQPRQWRRAARLLEESADLRDAADAEAYNCLLTAGRLYAGVGDARRARAVLERAAEHALARGALVDAATAYIDAAYAAADRGLTADARMLFDRAALLTTSPLLSATQREAGLQRVRG